MKKRVLSLCLVLALLLGIMQGISPSSFAEEISDDEIIEAALVYLNIKEGNCDSVNANDNGALSIGMIQWHGPRALTLLQQIVALIPEQALEILGEEFYTEIVNAQPADWNNRTVNEEEKAALVILLGTEESKQVQLAQARSDLAGYISHGRAVGMTTPAMLLYYMDLENQYGAGGAATVLSYARSAAQAESFSNLYELHSALLICESSYVQNYISRRISTYNYIVHTLGWESVPYHIAYDGNGGTGASVPEKTVFYGDTFDVEGCDFERPGYAFVGWNVQRLSDGAWYIAGIGWCSPDWITQQGYTKCLYTPGQVQAVDSQFTSNAAEGETFTFFAVWEFSSFSLELYENYSGKNYILGSDLTGEAVPDTIFASESYSLSVDREETYSKNSNSLKVTAAAAGAADSAVVLTTSTGGGQGVQYTAQEKTLTLSFWAKASDSETILYLCWDGDSNQQSVSLTGEWVKYSVPMNQTASCGSKLLLYPDRSGTIWLSQLQLEDGDTATDFAAEDGRLYTTIDVKYGEVYGSLPTLERQGYVFNGWFTAASGGSQVHAGDTVALRVQQLYAQWTKNWSCALYGHEWSFVEETAPTCNSSGCEIYRCIDCGAVKQEEIALPLGHDYGNWETVTPATCTTDGLQRRTCEVCGVTDTVAVPATGHIPGRGVTEVAPTCTEAGVEAVYCDACSILLARREIAPLGHTLSEEITDQEPTCTESGRAHKVCLVCGETVSAYKLAAVGHDWGEWTEFSIDGTAYRLCATCGQMQLSAENHVHSYEKSTVAPTCDMPGYDLYECICGDSYTENQIPPLGHADSTVVKTPTCTQKGYVLHSCSRCGDIWLDETEALGHLWDEGTVESLANANHQGVTTYTCLRCGETEKEFTPMTDICPGGLACPGDKFKDMPAISNWAHAGIDAALELGLFSGTSATTFAPADSMTRAMLVSVLYRMAGAPEVSQANPFSDVPENAWYTDAVIWAAECGVVSGTGGGKFSPNGDVTREQIATILLRYAIYKDYDFSARAELDQFSDYASVSYFGVIGLSWANASGILSGALNNGILELNPLGSATRAEAASILVRFVREFTEA